MLAETLSKANIPVIPTGISVLEFRVYNHSTGVYTWLDLSSRLISYAPCEIKVERTFGAYSFECTVASIMVDNADGWWNRLVDQDDGLFNSNEPYVNRLKNRRVRIGRRRYYSDGTSKVTYLGCGAIDDATTDNVSPSLTFTLYSLQRQAMERRGDDEKVNGHVIYGDWGDPKTGFTLYANRIQEDETNTVYRLWFENRAVRDLLRKICNCLGDDSPVIDDWDIDLGVGQRMCSVLSRPPSPQYDSLGVYCRAITWDETNALLWLGCDDPDSGNNAFLYSYNPKTFSYTRVAKFIGGGRVQKLIWNKGTDAGVVDTLSVITHVDIPSAVLDRNVTAWYFKVSTATTPVANLYVGTDSLACLSNYYPGTFCYRDGAWHVAIDNGDGGAWLSSYLGGDRYKPWEGMGNHWWNLWIGANIPLPFPQRLDFAHDSCLWPHYGIKKDSWLANTPLDNHDPAPTHVFLPDTFTPGYKMVRTPPIPIPDPSSMKSGVRFSLGQAGSTFFWQGRDSGKGSFVYATFDDTTREYDFVECLADTGALSSLGMGMPHNWQPTLAVPLDTATKLGINFILWNESASLSGGVKPTNGWIQYTEGSGRQVLDGYAEGWTILEAYPLSSTTLLACIFNMSDLTYELNILRTDLGYGHMFELGNRVRLLGPGVGGASGSNAFKGFCLSPTTSPYLGDGRVYFYEANTFMLFSWKIDEGVVQRNLYLGGAPAPIVEGETQCSAGIVPGEVSGVWCLFGVSCGQPLDQDGLTPTDSAYYDLWIYGRYFYGFIPLADFTGKTLHDIRNDFAQLMGAVHFYGPDGTWYFKKRPTSFGAPVATIDKLAEIKMTSLGYATITNYLSCIPYVPVIEPKPVSIPYSYLTPNHNASLARPEIKAPASGKVQEWRFKFYTDTEFSVQYRDVAGIGQPIVWQTPDPATGSWLQDYRGMGLHDYIVIPNHNWSGTPKAGDIFGFWVFPSEKRLQQLTDREVVEYQDTTSQLKYGQVKEAIDNPYIPRVLVMATLKQIVDYWGALHPLYDLPKVPITDAITPMVVVQIKDPVMGDSAGQFKGWINGMVQVQDSPTMALQLISDYSGLEGGGGGGGT